MENTEQQPDPRPGFYYVSAIDGTRSARVRGPFRTHVEALDALPEARRALEKLDPRAHFYAIGTCRCARNLGPGFLDAVQERAL
jgi:hypothetical protein